MKDGEESMLNHSSVYHALSPPNGSNYIHRNHVQPCTINHIQPDDHVNNHTDNSMSSHSNSHADNYAHSHRDNDDVNPALEKPLDITNNSKLMNLPNPPLIKQEPHIPHIPSQTSCSDVEPSSSDDKIPSSTSQNKSAVGNLVIKVVGDELSSGIDSNVADALMKKLGVKVVLQMENNDGEVVFEDAVSQIGQPNHQISAERTSAEKENELRIDPLGLMTGLTPNSSNKQDGIVNTVLNSIRELANRLARHESLKDCPICGDTVTGFHYGVQTCESCKGFFKRTVQNKKTFKCHRNDDCEVHMSNRKKCPACRFQKCCDVGMKVEGIREDRSRGGRSTYEGATAFLQRPRIKRCSESSEYMSYAKRIKSHDGQVGSPEGLMHTKPFIPSILEEIVKLEAMYEEPDANPKPCCVALLNDGDTNKFNSMLHITEHRLYQIVKWARNLPNFLNIHTEDQILLLQNSWAEITSLGSIWRSKDEEGIIQLSFGKTIDMKKAIEMDHEEVISRMLYVCKMFKKFHIDRYEYVGIKVLALMLPDVKGIHNREQISEYQNSLVDALMVYTTSHYPDHPLRFGELMLRLSEVQRLTAISRQQILQLKSNGAFEPYAPDYGLLMELLKHQFGEGANPATLQNKAAMMRHQEQLSRDIIHNSYTNMKNSGEIMENGHSSSTAPHTYKSVVHHSPNEKSPTIIHIDSNSPQTTDSSSVSSTYDNPPSAKPTNYYSPTRRHEHSTHDRPDHLHDETHEVEPVHAAPQHVRTAPLAHTSGQPHDSQSVTSPPKSFYLHKSSENNNIVGVTRRISEPRPTESTSQLSLHRAQSQIDKHHYEQLDSAPKNENHAHAHKQKSAPPVDKRLYEPANYSLENFQAFREMCLQSNHFSVPFQYGFPSAAITNVPEDLSMMRSVTSQPFSPNSNRI